MIDDPEAATIELLVRKLLGYVAQLLPPGPQRPAMAHEIARDTWEQFLDTEEADFRDPKAVFDVLCRIAREHIRVGV